MAKGTNEKLSSKALYDTLTQNEVEYYCGVPDSTLSAFGSYLEDHADGMHDIAANEGNAIGIATGYYLATSKVPLVYMQNSGLGNALDPLVSMTDPSVLGIPLILLIGWRGQPDKKDEPQHHKQGAITCDLLDLLGIPYVVLSRDSAQAAEQVNKAVKDSSQSERPYALLVEDGTFEPYSKSKHAKDYQMSREETLEIIIDGSSSSDAIVATNGKISRELFEYREKKQQGHEKDLLIVGAMGHASSVATGIAQNQPSRNVYCIDGDGAVLMHTGALAINSHNTQNNFFHIVINNGSHDSTGGQSTVGLDIDLPGIAKASGYTHVFSVHEPATFAKVLADTKELGGSVFIEVRVKLGARTDLMRPTIPPIENKKSFMHFLARPK